VEAPASALANVDLHDIAWFAADAALDRLDSRRSGLLDEEVERRRGQFGRNEVSHEKPP